MVDISGYKNKQQHENDIEAMVQQILSMSSEELREKMVAIESIEEPVIQALQDLKESGISYYDLDEEQKQKMDSLEKAILKMHDFVLLARIAIDRRLDSAADKMYFHAVGLAKKGNEDAKKMVEELSKIKQKEFKQKLKSTEN
jgi:hypothetical protein